MGNIIIYDFGVYFIWDSKRGSSNNSMNCFKGVTMKKNDIILIVLILVVAVGLSVAFYMNKKPGDMVIVSVNGVVTAELPLNSDTEYEIETKSGGRNLLIIQDGMAFVEEASCPDQICVNQKEIQKHTELIVCLPNQVVIEVQGENHSEVDGVAN